MRSILTLGLLGAFVAFATPSFAQGTAAAPAAKAAPAPAMAPAAAPAANSQQERMKECNAKATGMKGDEHKQFMSSCLSGKEPPQEDDAAGKDDRLQQESRRHEGRRAQEVHEHLPEGITEGRATTISR